MVDEAHLDLSGPDGGHDDGVVLIGYRLIQLNALQPLARLILPPDLAHAGHHRLEGAVRGRPADPPAPDWVDEIPDVVWKILGPHASSVVNDDARPAGDTNPQSLR